MSRIKVDRITNRAGTGDPLFPNGISVVGLTSLSNVIAGVGTFSNVTIGGTITYEDVTNQDVIGLSTFRAGVKVTTGGVEVSAGGVTIGGKRIDGDSQGIGIGTDNPESELHVMESKSGGSSHASSQLTLERDGTNYLQFMTANNGTSGLLFGDVADNDGAKIVYDHNVDQMQFNTGTVQRLRITTSGLKVTGQQTSNVTAISGTAIDCSLGNYFTKTITGSTTFTFTNIPASGTEYSMTVELDLNGSNAVAWPASVKWPADTAPTITDAKTQLFMFVTVDGGTKWRGGTLVDYTT